jgi:hypothetical protein
VGEIIMANRAGLAAAGAVLGGVPGVQKGFSAAVQTQRQEGRAQGKYQMEREKFEMLKDVMKKDKNYIDNLYKDIESHPTYGTYIHLMPERSKYSNDQKGKEAATADYAKLKSMVDKSTKAKDKGADFAPDMALTIKEWNALLNKELQEPTREKVRALTAGFEGKPKIGKVGPEGAAVPPQALSPGRKEIPQEEYDLRAQKPKWREDFYGAAAGVGAPGVLPKEEIEQYAKAFPSKLEQQKLGKAQSSRTARISKEMHNRRDAALDNYNKLLQMGDAKAKDEYEKFETLGYMLDNGIVPDDENEIDSSVDIMSKKMRKDKTEQIDRKLEAKMVFAKVQKDPMVKRFGEGAMKSALERAIVGTKFKSLDELFAAQGRENPYPEPTTGESEAKGPGIVKKGAELWKQGVGTIFGGGQEQPKQGAGRFKVKVKK